MLHSGDTLVAIYTARGDLVSAVLGTYLHSVTGQVPIKFILDRFRDDPSVGVAEGDIYYCNEALYGGIHNPDQFSIMPVFGEGELLGLGGVGRAPVRDRRQRAGRRGHPGPHSPRRGDEAHSDQDRRAATSSRNDLLLMMENFISRAPRMQVTDVKARVAACDRVRVRLQGLAQRRGNALVRGLFRRMIQQTAAGVAAGSRGGPMGSTATTCSWTRPGTRTGCCARRWR